ncbi:MAG: radical SAM protein [Dehalococcoidales bacterium]|nr:MAG: radical SAM protein [Dehalococcoidales bacterium]
MVILDSELKTKNMIEQHPCFNDKVHSRVGRIHLPVAPHCNIRCNFCEHRMCAGIKHPGWSEKLLSVDEAADFIQSVVDERQAVDFVVGVAGPGDALANEQTLQTLAIVKRKYPQIVTCLCTNGLLLKDSLEAMLDAGLSSLTVTINAADERIGKEIYSWVKYRGTIYRGEEAAALLISKQFCGIRKAVAAGFSVKVNSVLIPGVNDDHMVELAGRLKEMGIGLMNIMPLIPAGKMKGISAPDCDEMAKAREDCERIIPQFYSCEQCRSDVVSLPDKV